jgi:hypothetical protein
MDGINLIPGAQFTQSSKSAIQRERNSIDRLGAVYNNSMRLQIIVHRSQALFPPPRKRNCRTTEKPEASTSKINTETPLANSSKTAEKTGRKGDSLSSSQWGLTSKWTPAST